MIQAEHKKEGILLFDLDGTLWDSSQEVADSWNVILREQLPEIKTLTKEDIMSVMGKTMEEIAQTVLAGYQGDNARQVFKNCEIYENEYLTEHGAVLFPKVRETLENLRKAGYDMAVVSNCQSGYINAFYVSMKMSNLFCDMEEWGNTSKTKAENIRLVMERNNYSKAVYIGDTIKDERAAKDAQIPFIHAAYGFGTAEDADAVIYSIDELESVVEGVL
ncbi:MAG: HAD family hydrolase [Lachnospiraceae bacterium]|nr:HAD family hydrolase [Lachnospiraceae bacterium]